MKIFNTFLSLGLMLSLLACQQNQSDPQPDTSVPTEGTPTEAGKPRGAPVQKKIGPAGGSISTPDQALTLIIPAGALPRDTTITIQPVENKAWGGTGSGYELSPKNLELAKPADLIWNYSDADIAGSAPEALGIAFQQADQRWLGRQNITLDKAQRKAKTPISKLLPAAFYEAYYMLPASRSLVPSEHVELKVFFHAGHEDDSELAPLTMPTLLGKEQVRNWKLNGNEPGTQTDPQAGGLSINGNGASATYMAPNRIPNPNQVAVSVEVILKSKARLFLVSNMVIEAANAFQFTGARVDSAEIGTISVVDKEFFQISLSERNLSDHQQAIMTLNMLPFPGVGAYAVTDNGTIHISAMDARRKSWSDSYYPRNGKKVVGPLTVTILEYDRAQKRVKGKISGTLHYYDDKTEKHETTQFSARFNAASPY
ncbi:hypothetical protein [Dyadobacter crusticola]|uniref:hypothetical protein n=1 Tax=Dyadobacter crusticola TaxID=292407 RepID=UPI0004E14A7D|nr:hypothetical protein [Dyadobacter crusticola]